MADRNPERMKKLLTQNRLKKRARILVGRWASHGVSVSPVAHDRYWLLLDNLRGGRRGPLRHTEDFLAEVRTVSAGSDMLTLIGWSVDEEPALLVGAEKLMVRASALTQVYPDGFVLISDVTAKALLVDFDDELGTHVNVIDLSSAA